MVEGIYAKTGQLCPLKKIVALCKARKVRVLLDESLSFAALGETGRGITQHLGVDVCEYKQKRSKLYLASLNSALDFYE